MRSVILKRTETACINYFLLSGQTSYKIFKLFCTVEEITAKSWVGRDLWSVAVLHGAAVPGELLQTPGLAHGTVLQDLWTYFLH